ncbi:WD repeat-containing protein 44, partial [Lecanoromycetidae sp. Uapishka_2]
MADNLPQIRVRSDTQSRDANFKTETPLPQSLKESVKVTTGERPLSPENAEARPLSNGRSYPSKFIPTLSGTQLNAPNKSQILKRTNTQNILPPKMRTGAPSEEDQSTSETGAPVAPVRTSSDLGGSVRNENNVSGQKDKKNRVSFFSRFAPKKKDTLPEIIDNESEAGGDRRTEGMDADVFSQPIGYIPQFPSPPKYIKVRSHGKREKDFNRLFLAQELRGRTGVEIAQSGGRLVKNAAYKHGDKDGNAIWAMEFSKDGKHLAAGGKDYVVRVWAVISTKQERTAHEAEEEAAGKDAQRLNGLKYQTQIHVRSAHGKNAKGSKVTGIQAVNYPPGDPNPEVKLLITSNDSRIRVYNLRDKGLELKLKGNENSCSQIHASFSDDAKYIICGSEDRKAYIWPTVQHETEKDKKPMEMFDASSAIVTNAILAPIKTRQLLSASCDPLYDLCNPPPVTLISRTQSQASSLPPTEDGRQIDGSFPPTPATPDFSKTTKPEESPAYLARCAHPDGNIIVTADFMGHIKVFRQDCAYANRLRNNDSNFSKKMLGRTNSVATKHSNRSRRDSLQIGHPSSERILSWRQSISSNNGSNDNFRLQNHRSTSPRKSLGQASLQSSYRHPSQPSIHSPSLATDSKRTSPHRTSDDFKPPKAEVSTPNYTNSPKHDPKYPDKEHNPLMLHGEQSYMFWNQSTYQAQAAAASHLDPKSRMNRPDHRHSNGYSANASTAGSSTGSVNGHLAPLGREATVVSRLSSEEESGGEASSPDPG